MPRKPENSRAGNSPTASAPLGKQRYAALLRDVQKLLTRASTAVDEQKVAAHWTLGQRIHHERLDQSSGYHNAILRDLAVDARLSLRTLQYAVSFHAAYESCPKHPLSWLHYRTLLDCPDEKTRNHYTSLALEHALSARQLARRIADDRAPSDDHDQALALPRPRDPSYLYAARVEHVIDGDTLDLIIDLGFQVSRLGRFRLADIDSPELPASKARAARDFVYARLRSAKTIVVKTQRTDAHGRYVAHLFYMTSTASIATCFTQGVHLNAELVEQGHAERAV